MEEADCMSSMREQCLPLVLTSAEHAIQLLAIRDFGSRRRGAGGRAGRVALHAADSLQRLVTHDRRGGCGDDSGSGADHLLAERLAAGLDRAVGLIQVTDCLFAFGR